MVQDKESMEDVDRSESARTEEIEVVDRWKIFLSFTVVTGVSLLVITLFSDSFKTGREVVDGLLEYAAVGASTSVFACVCAAAVLLYIFDISYWEGSCGRIARRSMLLLLLIATCAFGLSLVRSHPYFPLTLFIFALPLAGLSLRMTALRNSSAASASWVLGTSFLFAALVCLSVWLLWLFGAIDGERQFWFSNRLRFSEAAQCNTTEFEAAGLVEVDGVPICTAAFLLWVSPFILFGVLLFIGLFLLLLTRMLIAANARSTQNATKLLGAAVFATLFGMYSSTSVGGAALELANVALAVFAVMLVGIVVVAGSTVGWDELGRKVERHGGVHRMGPWLRNWVHAFAVCFGAFVFPLFLALSFLNQQLRKVAPAWGFAKPLADDERQPCLTSLAMRKVRLLEGWDWGRVLTNVYWLCLVCWTLQFFSKMTYIFFNWLVATLQPLPYVMVLVIFVLIGLIMFLIPVVPGPAVYLTAGVLVVPLGKSHFLQMGGASSNSTFDACRPDAASEEGTEWAFWASCAVACSLSFALKLIAHVLQQKLIGENFRSRVSVRAFVAPNSIQMKAARYILSQPGITIAKSSILCGGPDWPTSVICGLLGLDCCSMLVGLTPIIVFTTPGTLLGAFMTEKVYANLNLDTLCVMIVLLVQTLMGVTFLHYVNRVIAEKQDVLASYEDDAEVAALDAAAAQLAAVVERVGGFHQAPRHVRAVFGSGVAAALLSTWVLMLQAKMLFQEFSITSCLDDLGKCTGYSQGTCDAQYYVIPALGIKPFGLVCLLLMAYGYGCLKYFQRWVAAAAKQRLAEDGGGDAAAELATLGVPEAPTSPHQASERSSAKGSDLAISIPKGAAAGPPSPPNGAAAVQA